MFLLHILFYSSGRVYNLQEGISGVPVEFLLNDPGDQLPLTNDALESDEDNDLNSRSLRSTDHYLRSLRSSNSGSENHYWRSLRADGGGVDHYLRSIRSPQGSTDHYLRSLR